MAACWLLQSGCLWFAEMLFTGLSRAGGGVGH